MAKRKLKISKSKPFERHIWQFLASGLDIHNVFVDFLDLTILSFLNNSFYSKSDPQKRQNREDRYMKIIGRYRRDDLYKLFPEILSDLIEVMEKSEEHYGCDYLGHFFENNITFGENGQFFTPKHITDMMTMMQGDLKVGSTACDPACGSGRTLLSCIEKNTGVVVTGCDLDRRCVLMATLNLFLHGATGKVIRMNSLSLEVYGGYAFGLWGGCVPYLIELDKEQIGLTSGQEEQIKSTAGMSQGELF